MPQHAGQVSLFLRAAVHSIQECSAPVDQRLAGRRRCGAGWPPAWRRDPLTVAVAVPAIGNLTVRQILVKRESRECSIC